MISAATPGDLWYSSHKQGKRALTPGAYESLRATVLDPATRFVLAPIGVEVMHCFEQVPYHELGDPFDRFIVATAASLGLPLVTKDRAISSTGYVEVIW